MRTGMIELDGTVLSVALEGHSTHRVSITGMHDAQIRQTWHETLSMLELGDRTTRTAYEVVIKDSDGDAVCLCRWPDGTFYLQAPYKMSAEYLAMSNTAGIDFLKALCDRWLYYETHTDKPEYFKHVQRG